ncbi:MAG: hypothetical protein INR73_19365 [Williamsia sp.]|nr:hypothetical protein [Williamsia sp.]
MRVVICFGFLLSVLVSRAQDDFPDYRSKRENFVKMQEKDLRSEMASFAMAGIDESTGKLPLKKISPKEGGAKFIQFEGNGIQVTITTAPFVAASHKLKYFDEKHLVRIDNKPFYGSYDAIPKTAISSVTVLINKDSVQIPEAAYSDIYNPSFTYANEGAQKTLDAVYLSNDNRTIYIYLLSKDTRGSIEVTWVIRDKKYLRRVVDFGLLK